MMLQLLLRCNSCISLRCTLCPFHRLLSLELAESDKCLHFLASFPVFGVFFFRKVYGSGSNVVILDEHLKRVQILKRERCGDVLAVATCVVDGKFAVLYSAACMVLYRVCVDGVTVDSTTSTSASAASAASWSSKARDGKQRKDGGFPWRWEEFEELPVLGGARSLSWGPCGKRLVVGGSRITMWRMKTDVANYRKTPSVDYLGLEMNVPENASYTPVFSRTVASPVEHVQFSPDGTMFASLGKCFCLLSCTRDGIVGTRRFALHRNLQYSAPYS